MTGKSARHAWHFDCHVNVMRVLRFASVAVLVCILGLALLPEPDGGHVQVEDLPERALGGHVQVEGLERAGGHDSDRGLTGGVSAYTTAEGDTLQGIGARFGVDTATLAAENALKANVSLPVGLSLRIDNRHIVPAGVTADVITINVPQRILFYEWERTVFCVTGGHRPAGVEDSAAALHGAHEGIESDLGGAGVDPRGSAEGRPQPSGGRSGGPEQSARQVLARLEHPGRWYSRH